MADMKIREATVKVDVHVNIDGSVELYFNYCGNTEASAIIGEYESIEEALELVPFIEKPEL